MLKGRCQGPNHDQGHQAGVEAQSADPGSLDSQREPDLTLPSVPREWALVGRDIVCFRLDPQCLARCLVNERCSVTKLRFCFLLLLFHK